MDENLILCHLSVNVVQKQFNLQILSSATTPAPATTPPPTSLQNIISRSLTQLVQTSPISRLLNDPIRLFTLSITKKTLDVSVHLNKDLILSEQIYSFINSSQHLNWTFIISLLDHYDFEVAPTMSEVLEWIKSELNTVKWVLV